MPSILVSRAARSSSGVPSEGVTRSGGEPSGDTRSASQLPIWRLAASRLTESWADTPLESSHSWRSTVYGCSGRRLLCALAWVIARPKDSTTAGR